jgi:hypothetical protein
VSALPLNPSRYYANIQKVNLDSTIEFVGTVARWVGWEGLTAAGTWALALIGGVAAWYAARQLNDFRKEARIKHLIDLVDQFEREPLATYRKALGTARTAGGALQPLDLDSPPPFLHDVMNFFEHMGYLLEGNYLDLDGVSVEFHYWILHVWADAREVIKVEQTDDPIYYEHFQKMVLRLQEYDRPRTGKLSIPTSEDVQDFYLEEARLSTGSPIPRQRRRRKQRHATNDSLK